ncbi:MAG: helix-turn-helix domain-containing protein [Ruminococcus flavefaciens]|nr:helix-turn-helix domain-containing protein [Ruminococcus flavefaciens]MCM1061669.1 helix-turn-helix domain-containing protein [Eubacterium sp.]
MNKKVSREALILQKRRKEMGMTQTDVAGQVGIQLQQYQLYEYGKRRVSSSSMLLGLRLCAVLELDPYELVFEKSEDWVKKVRKL